MTKTPTATDQDLQGKRVAWQGTDGKLHLGTVDEVTGSRAVVIEVACARRAGKLTQKIVRWSVVVADLQVQAAAQ